MKMPNDSFDSDPYATEARNDMPRTPINAGYR